jgi:hypothetical protein
MSLRTGKIAIILLMNLAVAKGFGASATLIWDPNPEADLAGYYVYFGTNSMDRIQVGKQTTITLSNLVAGSRYTIYATAYNSAGLESEPSESVFYTPAVEVADPVLSMQAVNGEIVISGSATPQQRLFLQAATSLNSPEWITVQTITPGIDGAVRIQLMEHLLNPRRFYRLAVAP